MLITRCADNACGDPFKARELELPDTRAPLLIILIKTFACNRLPTAPRTRFKVTAELVQFPAPHSAIIAGGIL